MVNIIRIPKSQPPPTGLEWVLIARNGGDPFVITGKTQLQDPVTIGDPVAGLAAVLDEAWEWAAARGVKTIYLQDR